MVAGPFPGSGSGTRPALGAGDPGADVPGTGDPGADVPGADVRGGDPPGAEHRPAAVSRLGRALEDLAERGVSQVLLDCSHLDHIDYRLVPALVERLERFEARAGVVVCGLSHYVRDLFRLAGCDARLRCWPTASDLLPQPASPEPGRECAS